jgi:peptide deformylase
MLSVVCQPVDGKGILEEFVSTIIQDMMYLLTNSKTGAGLAANQAGYDQRIIIVKDDEEPSGWLNMINPAIIEHSEDMAEGEESCLSYPGVTKTDAKRWTKISVDFITINSSGVAEVWSQEEFTGFQARIIQHEIDHLNGLCQVGEVI